MKAQLFLALLLVCRVAAAQTPEKDFPRSFQVRITNPSKLPRASVLIVIPAAELSRHVKGFNTRAFVVLADGKEIASQYNADDQDQPGIALVLPQLAASESRLLTVRFHPSATQRPNYPRLAHAELSHKVDGEWKNREYAGGVFKNVDYLRVPPQHKDHSWFIRYEGPGWESDKVGYRFYLDQRNATDVFGKKTADMVLQQVGQDGFDSYHHLQPWGMDVMKVGKSLGIGSIGSFSNGRAVRVETTDSVDCRIVENGPVYASIRTRYYGWQIDGKKYTVRSHLSIHGGTRLSRQQLTLQGTPENICTGIVKDTLATLHTHAGSRDAWGYLATYGNQSLNGDALGLAVLFSPADAPEFTGDPFSHIVKLKPSDGKVTYYFLAAWSGEPDGIQSEEAFLSYVSAAAEMLAHPAKVEIIASRKR